MYQKGKVYKAYAAKKDWITRAYLPVSKNYNMPFIISVVLLVIGFLFYTNSPILKWYTHAGEIVIGKRRKPKICVICSHNVRLQEKACTFRHLRRNTGPMRGVK